MFHNIKADIIYYKTTTDFELEFNLCGCCRMRLLSDKMQDKKSFVHSLARAVSRSSVILIVGPLFSENGTIQTVTEAINTATETVNNDEYGIVGEHEIKIIKNSTPLVTPDGYFGGCIIESGPQTMILLSDNKDVRKTIMKNLIHPYIEELYAAEIKQSEALHNQEFSEDDLIIGDVFPEETIAQPEEEISEDEKLLEDSLSEQENEIVEETPEATDSNLESTSEVAESEPETPEILIEQQNEEAEEPEPEEDTIDLFIEPTKLDRQTVERYTREYMIQEDEYNYGEDDYYKNNKPKRKNGFSLAVFIISIILLLVIVVLCYCIFFVPAKQGISPVENLQSIFNTMFG